VHTKRCVNRASHNHNYIATPNYSIFENLSQLSCVMSALEVHQDFLVQHTALLFVIKSIDYSIPLTMKLDNTNVKHHICNIPRMNPIVM
jgi:hypothetical protein